jgi:hypothetical protein
MDERRPCPRADLHTDCPEGYREWHAWAEEMSKTHEQERCPGCERWNIWAPKKRVRADA